MQAQPTIPATSFASLPDTGFVRLPQVLSVFPVSRSTWWAGVKSGRFPKPIKLGENTTAWRAEDIKALIEAHGGAHAERQAA